METKNKNQSEIKFRLTADEKAEIQLRAQKAGTNVSEFIRTCCLSNDKVIFLEEGKMTAQKLCEIYNHLGYCASHQYLNDDISIQLSHDLEELSFQITRLVEKLSDIRSDEEEDE